MQTLGLWMFVKGKKNLWGLRLRGLKEMIFRYIIYRLGIWNPKGHPKTTNHTKKCTKEGIFWIWQCSVPVWEFWSSSWEPEDNATLQYWHHFYHQHPSSMSGGAAIELSSYISLKLVRVCLDRDSWGWDGTRQTSLPRSLCISYPCCNEPVWSCWFIPNIIHPIILEIMLLRMMLIHRAKIKASMRNTWRRSHFHDFSPSRLPTSLSSKLLKL